MDRLCGRLQVEKSVRNKHNIQTIDYNDDELFGCPPKTIPRCQKTQKLKKKNSCTI